MKPWIIIAILLAVALCVVPWVRADHTYDSEPTPWRQFAESAPTTKGCWKGPNAFDGIFGMENGIPEGCLILEPKQTKCEKKMEQAMREIEPYIGIPTGTDAMMYWDETPKLMRSGVLELWNTVKQECWTHGGDK